MNPQEKAKILYRGTASILETEDKETTKELTLVGLDLIIEIDKEEHSGLMVDYWLDVRNEINKL